MKTEEKDGLRILTPSNEIWLTDSEETFFTQCIYLGLSDSPDNYHEVSDEYKLAREAELEANLPAGN